MLRVFPALAGMSGIRTELPACGVFAEVLPDISHGGMTYRFSFLRLSLHYLDMDPRTANLVAQGSYVRAQDPQRLQTRARVAVIPRRLGTTVHGLTFASNRVLHSGLDGEHGHFIAAYGLETTDRARAS